MSARLCVRVINILIFSRVTLTFKTILALKYGLMDRPNHILVPNVISNEKIIKRLNINIRITIWL